MQTTYYNSTQDSIGYGGICYISQVLNCDRKTIYKGITELKHPDIIEKSRVRAIDGGRKQSIGSIPGLHKKFLKDKQANDGFEK